MEHETIPPVIRVCVQCGIEFAWHPRRARPPLTCSDACRRARLRSQEREQYAERLEQQRKRRTRGSVYLGKLACQVPGCPNNNYAKGYCHKHYIAWHRTGNPEARPKLPHYAERTDKRTGYVYVGVKGRKGAALKHRLVMERMLGRALLPHESVHHINGVRDDNRPENLELWSKSQPSGQRVVDKIAWAVQFLTEEAPHLLIK